jgi:hypothetical protein
VRNEIRHHSDLEPDCFQHAMQFVKVTIACFHNFTALSYAQCLLLKVIGKNTEKSVYLYEESQSSNKKKYRDAQPTE